MKETIVATFLGTGTSQGVPVIGSDHPVCLSTDVRDMRLRSSFMVEKKYTRLVVDCGPDFRMQMLRAKVDRLDGILFTHEHNDHVLGIDDTRPLVFKSGKEMPIYALDRVIEAIKQRFPYVFTADRYPGVPRIEEHTIDENQSLTIGDLQIHPVKVFHGQLPILGYIFDQRLAYLTDVKFLPEESKQQLMNIEVLVISALRQERAHHAHLLLEDAIALSRELKAQQTYITHISYEMGFFSEVNSQLPKGISLAYDNFQIKM
ncbi:MBL fold metallo-hydrolase [Vaginella massiliensis]|uniref:MBL fold metallo-hydrolase n=1 Tax=Vaginella massiliensis TaxID=1816680 RepID=UPI003753AF70